MNWKVCPNCGHLIEASLAICTCGKDLTDIPHIEGLGTTNEEVRRGD